jgi:hypothetical protein
MTAAKRSALQPHRLQLLQSRRLQVWVLDLLSARSRRLQ